MYTNRVFFSSLCCRSPHDPPSTFSMSMAVSFQSFITTPIPYPKQPKFSFFPLQWSMH